MAKYDLVWQIWLHKGLSIVYNRIEGFSRLYKKFAARLLDSQPPFGWSNEKHILLNNC